MNMVSDKIYLFFTYWRSPHFKFKETVSLAKDIVSKCYKVNPEFFLCSNAVSTFFKLCCLIFKYTAYKLTASLRLPTNCENILCKTLLSNDFFSCPFLLNVFYAHKRLWVDVFKVNAPLQGHKTVY